MREHPRGDWKERSKKWKHYSVLEGEDKRRFLNLHQFDLGSKNAKAIYLWTEKRLGIDKRSHKTYTHRRTQLSLLIKKGAVVDQPSPEA